MKFTILITLTLALFSFGVQAQTIIPAKDALKHVGQKVTICEKVYDEDLKAFVVVLYLGGDRPNQLLTIVCRATSNSKSKHFNAPYKGKDICVTGVITKGSDGKPVIKISDPAQIKPFMEDSMPEQRASLH
ncbi:MAG: hypothetical protein JO080_14535 [Mucilaginibacter sp.]|nr:hypothetical protein [Mucilaginibacter sp.]